MKRILVLLLTVLAMTTCFAQNDKPEKASPITDMQIVRQCCLVNVEGRIYDDATLELESVGPDFIASKYRVKVKVLDLNGKKVYKKTFKSSYLYVFSDGQIQVGRSKFTQILIDKVDCGWHGVIREKEGIWSAR